MVFLLLERVSPMTDAAFAALPDDDEDVVPA
jgi:hypothetical protein